MHKLSINYTYLGHELTQMLMAYYYHKQMAHKDKFERWIELQVRNNGEFFYLHAPKNEQLKERAARHVLEWYGLNID